MQYNGNQTYDFNNVRVKRMALSISLFNHEHEDRCFEASLSLCGKASGKGVEIRMWGNGVRKLRFQFPVASQSKGPPPIGWFRWSVFQQGRGDSQK